MGPWKASTASFMSSPGWAFLWALGFSSSGIRLGAGSGGSTFSSPSFLGSPFSRGRGGPPASSPTPWGLTSSLSFGGGGTSPGRWASGPLPSTSSWPSPTLSPGLGLGPPLGGAPLRLRPLGRGGPTWPWGHFASSQPVLLALTLLLARFRELYGQVRFWRERALTCPLTGLPNRRALEMALEREAARVERGGPPSPWSFWTWTASSG